MVLGGVNPQVAMTMGRLINTINLGEETSNQLVLFRFENDCEFANDVLSPYGADEDVNVYCCKSSAHVPYLHTEPQLYGFAVIQMAFTGGVAAPESIASNLYEIIAMTMGEEIP